MGGGSGVVGKFDGRWTGGGGPVRRGTGFCRSMVAGFSATKGFREEIWLHAYQEV